MGTVAPATLRLSLGLVLTLLGAEARADEKNPAVEACAGKASGAPCSSQQVHQGADGHAKLEAVPGSCQPDECCALDYSKGSPPQTTCGPCLACKAGGPPPTTTDPSGDGGAVEPPRTSDGDTTPPAQSPNGKRGCAIAADAGPGAPAMWLGALLVLGTMTRKRPRIG